MLETCNFVKPQNFSWFHWLNDVLQVPAVWEAVRWRVLPGRQLWPRRPHPQLSARRTQSHRLGLSKGTVSPVSLPSPERLVVCQLRFFAAPDKNIFLLYFLLMIPFGKNKKSWLRLRTLLFSLVFWLVQKLLCKLKRTYVMCMLFQVGATCEKKSFNILGWCGGR